MSSSKNRSQEKFIQMVVVVLALTATPKLLTSVPSTRLEPVLAQSASPATSPNTTLAPAPTDNANTTSTETKDGTFLWWLILLLGIPLLGFLGWQLKGGRSRSAAIEDTPETPDVTPPTVPPDTTGVGGVIASDITTPSGESNAATVPGITLEDSSPEAAEGVIEVPIPTQPTDEIEGISEATDTTVPEANSVMGGVALGDSGTTASTAIDTSSAALEIADGIAEVTAGILAGETALAGLTPNSHIGLDASNSTQVYAHWDVPQADKEMAKQQGGVQFHLRIYDVTDINLETQPAHDMQGYDCNEVETARLVSVPVSDRDYLAEIGYVTDEGQWLVLARSNSVRVSSISQPIPDRTQETPTMPTPETVALGAAALADGGVALAAATTDVLAGRATLSGYRFNSHISLDASNSTQVYAQWEVPQADKETAKQQGGVQFHLRIYDVTDINLETQPAHDMQGYDCNEIETARLVSVPVSDRDYLAEIGYVTDEGQWLVLARSNSVRVSSISQPIPDTAEDTPVVPTSETASLEVAGGAALAQQAFSSRIGLDASNSTQVYAQWEVPQADKETAKQQGGVQFHLRIYDVTDINLETQPSHDMQGYDCNEIETARLVSVPVSDRNYLAEIGYVTDEGQWLVLARSHSVRVSSISELISDRAQDAPTMPTSKTAMPLTTDY